MSRTEPGDLPDDYGVDEQAETLAKGEPPADDLALLRVDPFAFAAEFADRTEGDR